MKKALIVLACLAISGVVVAGPPAHVEIALIDGGENGRNGGGDQLGLEVTGGVALGEHWYVGGILGRFDRDSSGGDIENTYFNAHGGYVFDVAEKTGLFVEAGLWLGEEDDPGSQSTDPRAFEAKAGVNQALTNKFSIFGTLAWVTGDLDTGSGSNLRNYVWSLGGAYSFTELFSLNLKVVNGVNGVNGQDQVLRLGARFTF